MNIKDAIGGAAEELSREGIGSPKMAAESLMMFALGCDRGYLYAHPERELSANEEQRFSAAVRERATGKPLQYITGRQEFWGLEFAVSSAVLIPRPETEHLVEQALEVVRGGKLARPRIADVGTGSGCVIVALASELREAELHAT